MNANSVKFKKHRCFKDSWSGFDVVKPVNVIIGRNNSGKTHLLDLVEALCDQKKRGREWEMCCTGILEEEVLRHTFPEARSGGVIGGNWWHQHGHFFVGKEISWQIRQGEVDPNSIVVGRGKESEIGVGLYQQHNVEHKIQGRIQELFSLLRNTSFPLQGNHYRRLTAERDIRPEPATLDLALGPSGEGASNIFRRIILTSHDSMSRDLIQRDLLAALNEIFAGDGHFTEIQVKIHDEPSVGQSQDYWEIYLGESSKGLVPLSRSGSGLKTVILVLLNLLVLPAISKVRDKYRYVFCFEELENNLHPALLRRLLTYIEKYAVSERSHVFLTTHSSAALDIFSVSENAQIIHVTHNGESASAKTVSAHFDRLGVVSELGVKPSDLLQANGIIWVEGPSDCIYMNRWIDIVSGGKIREGRDYQCAFYGGSLLARAQFTSPEKAETELINLFRINSNIVVVCDGDRRSARAKIKDRVRRINREVRQIPNAHIWITKGREIENYLPGNVIAKVFGVNALPDPTQHESFFPKRGTPGDSYLENHTSRKAYDKMDLAIGASPFLDITNMAARFDWQIQIQLIVDKIQSWKSR